MVPVTPSDFGLGKAVPLVAWPWLIERVTMSERRQMICFFMGLVPCFFAKVNSMFVLLFENVTR